MMTRVILEKGKATEKLWQEVGTERNTARPADTRRGTHTERSRQPARETDRQTGLDQSWGLGRLGGGSGHISSLGALPVGSGAAQSRAG